jgi:hypothetical protein
MPFSDMHVLHVETKTGAPLTEEKTKALLKGTKFELQKFEVCN